MTRVHNCEIAKSIIRFLIIVLVLLALLPGIAQAAGPKRILIVYSFGRDFAPYHVLGQALRSDLTQLLKEPVAFQEVSLDVERGGKPMDERLLVEYLVHRNRDAPPDLVISVANPAMLFCLRYRDQLSSGRPILITGIDQRRLKPVQLGPNDQAITVSLDFPALAHTVLSLQPDTKTLALVLGSTDLERFWAKEIMRELVPLSERGVHILPPDGASLEQLEQRVASLPPKSAVLYYMFAVGADGVPHENVLALAAIRKVSSAPVFGMFDDQLGHGIVGGQLVDARKMGSTTAELAIRMLGNPDLPGNVTAISVPAPAFDWRELQRWGISESRLPANAEVRFRPPSLWEENRTLILVGSAIVLLQGVLIAALMLQRTMRHHAEKTTLSLSGRLLTAHEDERRRLARELHDDLTQRLARLAIDAGRMELAPAAPEGMRPLREDLIRLSEDVHALSYRLHPSVLDDLGLVEALRVECDRVARQNELRVEVDAESVPDGLPIEASLCLFRVAQEALSNAARHANASAITVILSLVEKGLQLAVSDNGCGFEPKARREHVSLGLASMNERVRQLSGALDIESTPGRGTTVVAWIPL